MDPIALLMVVTGSVAHMGWNLLAKNASSQVTFLWLAAAPVALISLACCPWILPRLDQTALLCIGASGTVHAGYFFFLGRAYRTGNISFVYPYCRGIGAVLATLFSVTLLGERPSWLGWVGIALTVVAPLVELGRPQKNVDRKTVLLTLSTALCIGAYLTIDAVGVRQVAAQDYVLGLWVPFFILLAPMALADGPVMPLLRRPQRVLIGGLCMAVGYALVLAAMRVAPLGYVVAARSTGILLSGVCGRLFFAEQVTRRRWLAIALISAGITCIGLAPSR
ncbi:MAG: EamA family transporter [Deltaproteobacteria bacterium]|nr:EamA family transporter [Deltaproteobacteria bacterium]